MALGGGTFITPNKGLPGTYINFVSAKRASSILSDRGVVTIPMELDWGASEEVIELTGEDFRDYSQKILGYGYHHAKLKGLRDIFLNANTCYLYRINSGGVKASNEFAEAKYAGTRGNALKIVIETNVDNASAFDVKTVLDQSVVDVQTATTPAGLKANDFVSFKSGATLAATAGKPLTGGTNGTVSGTAYQNYLNKMESYSFNAMGAVTTDETTKGLLAAYEKRMREEMGIKFQLVLYNYAKADYYGTISVKNKVMDSGASEASMVYWTLGAIGGCEVNRSVQNRKYDGEFTVNTEYTQTELLRAIKAGEFVFHRVGQDVRVLEDVNTQVTVTESLGDIFRDNQTVRVMDQIANDIAVLFNTKYLGAVPNDEDGRTSLWSDIVKHHERLADIRAIENFSDGDVVVTRGEDKKSVIISDAVTVVNAMSKLYMTVTVA